MALFLGVRFRPEPRQEGNSGHHGAYGVAAMVGARDTLTLTLPLPLLLPLPVPVPVPLPLTRTRTRTRTPTPTPTPTPDPTQVGAGDIARTAARRERRHLQVLPLLPWLYFLLPTAYHLTTNTLTLTLTLTTYSFGVLLFEIMSRSLPYAGVDTFQVRVRVRGWLELGLGLGRDRCPTPGSTRSRWSWA